MAELQDEWPAKPAEAIGVPDWHLELLMNISLFGARLKRGLSLINADRVRRGLSLIRDGRMDLLIGALTYLTNISMAGGLGRAANLEHMHPQQLEAGRPLVSVIIPCFNYGGFIRDAVESVLAQTLHDLEVIVVDGGSTDGKTAEELKRLQYPRTRVYFREGRHFAGSNRNFGISYSNARYICCLDADDKLDATYLEKAVFLLETYGYDAVSTGLQFFGTRNGTVGTIPYPVLSDLISSNSIFTCALFRRVLWERIGGFWDYGVEKAHAAEDWDFWIRLAAEGARLRNIVGEPLFWYRTHHSASLSSGRDVPTLVEQRRRILTRNADVLSSKAIKQSKSQKARRLRTPPMSTTLALRAALRPSCKKGDTLLLALPSMVLGGAERLLSGIVGYLIKNGWRVIIVSTGGQAVEHGDFTSWFKEHTSEIYALPRFLEFDGMARFSFLYYFKQLPERLGKRW